MKAKASTPAKLKEYGKDGEELPYYHAKLQAQPKRSWILKMQKLQKAPKGSVGEAIAEPEAKRHQRAEAIAEPEAKARPKTGGAQAIAEPEPKGKAKGKGKEPKGKGKEPEPKGKAKGKGKRSECKSSPKVMAYSLGKWVQKLTADEECVEEELLRLQMIWKDKQDRTKPENREHYRRSPRGLVIEKFTAERLAAQCTAQGLEARAKAKAAGAEEKEQLAAQCKAHGLEKRAQGMAAYHNQQSAAASSSSSAGPRFDNGVFRRYLVKVVKS